MSEPCIGDDPLCPCQDGLVCHYRDSGKTKAWPIPEPVAWRWSESEGKHWFAWTGRWDNHERAKELGCLIEYAYLPTQGADMTTIREVLELAVHAMRAPLDDWKGELERKALDAARAILKAQKEKI